MNNKKEKQYESCDAPPLDFSFKNIKNLQDIKFIQPRQGTRLNPVDDSGKPINVKIQEKQIEGTQIQQTSKQEADTKGQKKKNQITKLLPQNNISSVVNTMVTNSALKNISTKAKQQLQKQKKKAIQVKLVCLSLMLCYNKIRQIKIFQPTIAFVMPDHKKLQWLDLSHNYLQKLDYDFNDFPELRTLYLHCNYLYDLNDFSQLSNHKQLKTIMIHGNPLTEIPNFRSYLISILPNLKKIDSVLISKKQVDNATFLRTQIKKFPLPKNPTKPPVQRAQEQQQQKQGN